MPRPSLAFALAAAAFLLPAASARADSQTCRVADPTGTPLNIRLQPNGAVVGRARNGTKVQVFREDTMRDAKGRLWVSIALPDSEAPDGYVLAAYLSCR